MKSVFKVLGVIALAAVIGFGFVSCGDGDGGDGGGGGGGIVWADLVGDWTSDSNTLKVNPVIIF